MGTNAVYALALASISLIARFISTKDFSDRYLCNVRKTLQTFVSFCCLTREHCVLQEPWESFLGLELFIELRFIIFYS